MGEDSPRGVPSRGREATTAEREAIAHALALWREGARLLARYTAPEQRLAYEAAVLRALPHLARYTTMAELVAVYFADAAGGEKERWLTAVCTTESGRLLNEGIVEDAAFWRRAQALIAASQGRG